MDKSKRILKVPEDDALRNLLRKESRLFVEEINLLPPAPFAQMEELAVDLLKKLKVSEEYIDFTIILLGNESWRKTVESIPYQRRLLLLPQCLKDNSACKGVFDELGLICAACKACPVDDILLEAEKLGYTTLVAEGTTVAIGLVEEGSIDAVIGVSCMPVLQRSFGPVSKSAVPVIGLPLMYDGCENTKIDLPWLFDEVRAYEFNKNLQPISISALKWQIEDFYENGALDKYFNTNDHTENLAKEYIQIGGQRMRPVLAALSYKAYSSETNEDVLHQLSLIIECFHKASLVHDDIEDESDLRYNKPTAHKKYGIAQAINIGDFLVGKGYRVLAELPVKAEIMAKGFQKVSESHLKLTQGQGADILFNQGRNRVSRKEILQIFRDKTGEAIKVALLLGAILGEAEDSDLHILTDFSDLFGIAYQIRDDLNEFRAEEQDEKISDFPFLIALLYENGEDGDFVEVSGFRKRVYELDLVSKADEILNNYIQHCYNELDKLDNAKLRLSLYAVLGKIFKD